VDRAEQLLKLGQPCYAASPAQSEPFIFFFFKENKKEGRGRATAPKR